MGNDTVIKKQCLNVGSGVNYKATTDAEKWVNVDINPKVNPDLVCCVEELTQHFTENKFDEVHMLHVLEHCFDTVKVMEQIWRVLKNGGKLVSTTPYFTSENAYADPTHVKIITPITYAFFCYPAYEANAKTGSHMSQLFPECDFDIIKRVVVPIAGDDVFKSEAFALKHYFNIIEEFQVELKCVKPIRTFDIAQYQKRTQVRS